MDIRDKVQIDAIKDREEYSICDYGTHVLIYNGTYGVYITEEDMMLNPKRYEKNEDITRLDPYDVEDITRSATIIKESITFSGEIANAVIDYGREKTWIWQSVIKKFGKRRMYGVADVHMEGEEKKIVVVMDAEGNAIGIIKTMADIEAQKNDTYLDKGTKIVLEGRIQTGNYTKTDGTKVHTTEIVMEDMRFTERKE